MFAFIVRRLVYGFATVLGVLLLLFVLADGWNLVVKSLVESFL